ncbi:endonuclease/exonuclease/phosphatase family protein [Geodermatophilus nigrescens]|uniref:Endonuclease/Exonuclease/phosphatase family protein n=1 Tax=Geodermatophilus nigrescens TaxID=1070870 RepID=A0A1M5JPB3_9ACTN|nr:endonuclease/exonuclease/phosphatase family protein [Geodermatophilus nigrescens]SHG42109.1 Endonuclease/Exonuclease/phosphatase family protein [Geodermatophilus nigrescens]
MRIGTWNVNRVYRDSERAPGIKAWLTGQQVDLWLLTEIHGDWHARGDGLTVSPKRSWGAERQRWAAIETSLTVTKLAPSLGPQHPGEEGLAMARVRCDDANVLVACSVLPLEGSGENWVGLPEGRLKQFRFVLRHHIDRINSERRAGEAVIWGGDFTQELKAPYSGGTPDGAEALRSAFEELDLRPLTESVERLKSDHPAIDHLAVSPELATGPAETHRPPWSDGKYLSDHAAYTAEIACPGRSVIR